MQLSNNDWKQKLTPEQFSILREGNTETAFTGALLHHTETGDYLCAACKSKLFDSDTKFDSGSGWPSFYDVKSTDAVRLIADPSHGLDRVEVRCVHCDSHLGHVFNDAYDQPTGVRFCINSAALEFHAKETK